MSQKDMQFVRLKADGLKGACMTALQNPSLKINISVDDYQFMVNTCVGIYETRDLGTAKMFYNNMVDKAMKIGMQGFHSGLKM